MLKIAESFPGFFVLRLPVPGQLGPRSKFDRSKIPDSLVSLEIVFDCFPKEPLYQSTPAVFGSKKFADDLLALGCSGFAVAEMIAKKADQYSLISGRKALPKMVWLQIHGRPGIDDFGTSESGLLVVSARVLELAKRHGLSDAMIYDGATPPDRDKVTADIWDEARSWALKLKSQQRKKSPWFGDLKRD
jgi:hypothetical protein